jgi:DNA-binding response OmpR family regulator
VRGKVLVVDDDRKTVDSILLYLEHAGYAVRTAYTGPQALEELRLEPPDLIVLDVMLPRIDGLEVCRRVREHSTVPVILLTARASEEDRLRGLDLGADDYVTKPFSPRELVARVRTVLRRTGLASEGPAPLAHGDLELDRERHEARLRGKALALTPNEFRLLEAFMQAPGHAFTREELVLRAFGDDYAALERTVDAHVMNLRRKIEDDPARPAYLRTVFGVGYRFAADKADA